MVAPRPRTACTFAASVRLSTPPERATPTSRPAPMPPSSAWSACNFSVTALFSMFALLRRHMGCLRQPIGGLRKRSGFAVAAQALAPAARAARAQVLAFGFGAQRTVRPPRELDPHPGAGGGNGSLAARKHAARHQLMAHAQC